MYVCIVILRTRGQCIWTKRDSSGKHRRFSFSRPLSVNTSHDSDLCVYTSLPGGREHTKIFSPPPAVPERSAVSCWCITSATLRLVREMCFTAPRVQAPRVHASACRRASFCTLSFQPVMIGSSVVGSGLSWHRTLPLCVVAGDRKLSFWMTEM